MNNMYNAIPQGRIASSVQGSNQTAQTTSNPVANIKPPSHQTSPVSKECADAIRSIALAHINLGNKAEYYSPEMIYKSSKRKTIH